MTVKTLKDMLNDFPDNAPVRVGFLDRNGEPIESKGRDIARLSKPSLSKACIIDIYE